MTCRLCSSKGRNIRTLHAEEQDTSHPVWLALLDLVEETAIQGLTTFEPYQSIPELKSFHLVTLPSSISKMKSVEKVQLYGSTLSRIPPEIGEMESLSYLNVYTSYALHWLPYEVTHCPIKDTLVSTRTLYGNYKNRALFPLLKHDRNLESLELVAAPKCSVCRSEFKDRRLNRWISLAVGTDVFPLLVQACSMDCLHDMPASYEGYVKGFHGGGDHIEQPPSRFV